MLNKNHLGLSWNNLLKDAIGVKTLLVAIMITQALILIYLNSITYKYSGGSHLNTSFLKMIPLIGLLFLAGRYIRFERPRITLFFDTLWAILAISIAVEIVETGMQLTPFHLYDQFFYSMDLSLGFHTTPLMHWTFTHHTIYELLRHAYNSLDYQTLFTPLLLAILYERRRLGVFLISVLILTFIGMNLYYFFPTTDPAAVIHNPYFSKYLYMDITRFNEIHNHLPLTSNPGGMIGFPSFHVMLAITVTYAFRNRKYIFYPLALLNACLIISTMALGWHFLMDVIGGIVVVSVSILLSELLSSEKYDSNALTLRIIYQSMGNFKNKAIKVLKSHRKIAKLAKQT